MSRTSEDLKLDEDGKKRARVFAVGIFALVLLDFLLKVAFSPGINSESDLQIAEQAWWLSSAFQGTGSAEAIIKAFSDVRSLVGIRTTILIIPTGLLYAILGVKDFASISVSLISSLLLTILICLAVAKLSSTKTALLAGFIWVVFPSNVQAGSSLSFAMPLMAATLGLFLLGTDLLGKNTNRKQFFFALVAMGLLVIVSARPDLLLVTMLFLIFLWVDRRRPNLFQKVVMYSLVAWGFTMVFYSPLATATISQYEQLLDTPASPILFILPLALLSFPLAWLNQQKGTKELLILFAVTYTTLPLAKVLNWTSKTVPDYAMSTDYLWLVLVWIVMGAIGLSAEDLPASKGLRIWFVPYFVALIPALILLGLAQNPTTLQDANSGLQVAFQVSEIAGGLLVILLFGLPLLHASSSPRFANVYVAVLLAAFSISMIRFNLAPFLEERAFAENSKRASSCLEDQSLGLPVSVQNRELRLRLDYLSGFEWKANQGAPVHQQSLKELQRTQHQIPTVINNSYILLESGEANSFSFVPYNWSTLGVFGEAGKGQLTLYGVSLTSTGEANNSLFAVCN